MQIRSNSRMQDIYRQTDSAWRVHGPLSVCDRAGAIVGTYTDYSNGGTRIILKLL